ncbi:hypothetical protein UFOVP326_48 [uncultured Caudovirales phage]|uniref:Uncharacterized protein n=1 Tax=uncultured Caudovirales phage TaxID=2100421 RepID=A0A6J5LX31_9CAUD|nr:hypothetical protein UFOVP326_48 [uncultured Caudovirales phage]
MSFLRRSLAALLVLLSPVAARAQLPAAPAFVDGITLNAALLNAALAAPTIGGGTINGAVIGGILPMPGTFTALTASGAVTLTGAITATGTGAWAIGDGNARKTFTHTSHLAVSAGRLSPLFLVHGNAFGTITDNINLASVRAFNVNSDSINAEGAQGGGLTHNYFGSTVSAGSVGGRTNLGTYLLHQGSTPSTGNKFHVALAGFADATGSAGGAAGLGNSAGNLFGLNVSARLKAGSGIYWEQAVGAEINVGTDATTAVNDKVGLQIVQWGTDAVPANRTEAGLVFAAQVGTGGNQVTGWKHAILVGVNHGTWPMHPTGTIMGFGEQNRLLAARYPLVVANGIDFATVPAKFTARAFASPGFAVDGTGQMVVGSNTIGWGASGLTLGAAGRVGTVSGIAAGGTGYRVGDIVRGPDGGVYEVATVSAGAITGLTTIKAPTITSGAAPSNPRALLGGMGNNAAINVTWAEAPGIVLDGQVSMPRSITYAGVVLQNVKFVPGRVATTVAGDNDLYTVPAGRKAIPIQLLRVLNRTAGSVTFYASLKIGGTYYRLGGNGSVAASATGTISYTVTPVLVEGQGVAVNDSVGDNTVGAGFIEFDAATPIASVVVVNPPASSTIYTVPAGKSAQILNLVIDAAGGGGGSTHLAHTNQSGGSVTRTVWSVPSGGAAANGNLVTNVAGQSAATQAVSVNTLVPSMAAGDFIRVDLSDTTAGQVLILNYREF